MSGSDFYAVLGGAFPSLQQYYTRGGYNPVQNVMAVGDFFGNGYNDIILAISFTPFASMNNSNTSATDTTEFVALKSDGTGDLTDVTQSVFPNGNTFPGEAYISSIADLNGDGTPDIVFAMNEEDGRLALSPPTNMASDLAVLMSSSSDTFNITSVGPANWYHAASAAPADGTLPAEIVSAGYLVGGQEQTYGAGGWSDQSATILNDNVLVLPDAIANDGTRYIVGSTSNYPYPDSLSLVQQVGSGPLTLDWSSGSSTQYSIIQYVAWNNQVSNADVTYQNGQVIFSQGYGTPVALTLNPGKSPLIVVPEHELIFDMNANALVGGLPTEAAAENITTLLFYRQVGGTLVQVASPLLGTDLASQNQLTGAAANFNYMEATDVNGDGHQDLVLYSYQTNGLPIVYLNDGTGELVRVVDSALPQATSPDFVEAQAQFIDLENKGYDDCIFTPGPGYSVTYFGTNPQYQVFIAQRPIATGPGNTDPAYSGAPGFNEAYYLQEYPAVAAEVAAGTYASGLAQYLAAGRAAGNFEFAPNTIVWGIGDQGVVTFDHPMNDYIVTRTASDIVTVSDLTAGRDGTDTLHDVNVIAFSDQTVDTQNLRTISTITGTVPGQTVSDNATVDPFSGVVINDTNPGQTETVTVTPSTAANGTFSNLGSGSVTSGVYSVSGTAAAVTAALEVLVFTPTAGEVNPGQSVTTTFTIAVSDTAGQNASDGATSVIATATSLAIGGGVDVLGLAETDNFYLAGNGQLGFSYLSGVATNYVRITSGGSPFVPSAGTTALGTGLNLFRAGGHDIFLRSSSGALSAEEINTSGQILASAPLLANALPFTMAAGGSVIGTGYDLWGDGGVDVFMRTSTNQMTAAEFNSSGVEVAFNALTAQGNPFYLDAISTVIGSGLSFWGTGNPDIFVRTGTGQIQGWEFNGSGVAQVAHPLTAQGNPFIVDNATTVVGTGFDFWGSGNADMFLRGASGNISAWEFSYVGAATVGQNLMIDGSNAFALDAASTIVGTGLDFLGTTYEDIFVRSGTGQLSVYEFNPSARETASVSLSISGNPVTIDGGTNVIGAGMDFLHTGNHDLYLRNASGQISSLEFNASGVEMAQTALMNGASQLTLASGSTVIGTGFNLLGSGNNDIFVRTPVTNAITAYEYSSNGALTGSVALMVGGNPFQLDGSSTIIGSGYDFWGTGNHDIFVRTSTDQIDAWEFTAAGVATVAAQLTVGPLPYLLDGGSTIVGSGVNFWGSGGSDMFIRSASGAMSVWEFNSTGAATVAHGLSGFTLDGTSQVIGTSVGLYTAGNVDLYSVTAGGQLTVHEVNSSGAQTTATTFTLSGVPQTDTVVGAGTDSTTAAKDIILQTATGQTTVYDISGTTLTAQSGLIVTTESNGSVVTVGTAVANTLTAGSAATTLIGNGGNDIYDLASNFSQATIVNGVSGNSASGTLVFQSGSVAITNLWFDRVNDQGAVSGSGNDLRIDVLGTTESVTVDNWFSDSIHQALAEIEVTDGLKFVDSGLNSLLSAMSSYESAHPTFNPPTAAGTITDPTVLAAVNAAWHS